MTTFYEAVKYKFYQLGDLQMDPLKQLELETMRLDHPDFAIGDTIKVYVKSEKVKKSAYRHLKVLLSADTGALRIQLSP